MYRLKDHSLQAIPTWKVWILACRPKTLTAAVIPILVGTALASFEVKQLQCDIIIWALFAAIFIQIGTNLSNDAIDYKKGADTINRLGPMRVTQSGLLTIRQVLAVAAASFAVSTICTIPLVYVGGWPIIAILVISILSGFFYTGGPYPLAYVGLGDLFVLIFFGLIATCTTYYLQTGALSLNSLIAGFQVGMLATVLIAINNLRDREQDEKVGKNTLAVVLGEAGSKVEIVLLLFLTYILNLFWMMKGNESAALLTLLTLPLSILLIYRIYTTPPSLKYNKFLGMAALIHLLFGTLFSLGLWIG